jgi:predicted nucleotidyltransferase
MMHYLRSSPSTDLSLEEALTRLSKSEIVDGLALFGSQTTTPNPASDYDLLILISEAPVSIFQMITSIAHRLADIVFVETAMVDALLKRGQPVASGSFEGMFLQKMRSARIIYDASHRLTKTQRYARADGLFLPVAEGERYTTWFWLNFGLIQLKRMIQAENDVYQTTVDIMLMGALSSLFRDYYRLRDLPWEGEKAAVRYLEAHDAPFLRLFRLCAVTHELERKLALYEELVFQTLGTAGEVWTEGVTAVYLRNSTQPAEEIDTALTFWKRLLT